MRFALMSVVVTLAAVVSSAQTGGSPGLTPEQVPATLQPALARAEQGMNALQAALLARLREQMAAEGPSSAVTVCRKKP